METKFNFNSAVCTSREQSERLLALGLKKETADCYYWQECDQYGDPNGKWHLDILNDDTREHFEYLLNLFGICLHLEDALFIPAWSLHRLWCLLPKYVQIETYEYGRKYIAALDLELDAHLNVIYKEGVEEPCYDQYFYINDAYESVCRAIEWLINEGYFNKEYLV